MACDGGLARRRDREDGWGEPFGRPRPPRVPRHGGAALASASRAGFGARGRSRSAPLRACQRELDGAGHEKVESLSAVTDELRGPVDRATAPRPRHRPRLPRETVVQFAPNVRAHPSPPDAHRPRCLASVGCAPAGPPSGLAGTPRPSRSMSSRTLPLTLRAEGRAACQGGPPEACATDAPPWMTVHFRSLKRMRAR
jgi:hypothetical protein